MNSNRKFVVSIFVLVAISLLASPVVAQSGGFDIAKWLTDRDKNKSGSIEPNELNDRDRKFIEKMGVDTKAGISISSVVNKIHADRKNLAKKKADELFAALPRKVPGFGEHVEKSELPGFGLPDDEQADKGEPIPTFEVTEDQVFEAMTSIKDQFGKKIAGEVNSIFDQHDKNKDGILNPNELTQISWTGTPWKNDDENNDGKISKIELAKRIVSRSGGGDAKRKREKERQNRKRKNVKAEAASSSMSVEQKAIKYAKSTLEQHDENNNGKIDGEEFEKIGIMKKADLNGDREVTLDEMIAQASGKSSVSGNSVSRSREQRGKQSRSRGRGSDKSKKSGEDRIARDLQVAGTVSIPGLERTPSSDDTVRNRREKTSRSFNKKDKNGDGHITLVEYAGKLTQESIKDFQSRDTNGDGVITGSEWGN